MTVEMVGWVATAVFVLSYFCRRPSRTRLFQMVGAVLWTGYGLAMHAPPVIVANLLVFSSAAWAAWRGRHTARRDGVI